MRRIVLVIEDNPDIRENIKEILDIAGYIVHTAASGEDGIRLAGKIIPDIILCDVIMPVLDGYTVLRELGSNPKTRHIPFVFVTSQFERSDLRKAMDLGADDYLSKPFSGEELLSLVSSRLKKSGATLSENPDRAGYNSFTNDNVFLDNLFSLGEKIASRRLRKKDLLFTEGDTANSLYIIVSGKIKASKINEQGKEYITRIYNNGEFLGYSSLLGTGTYEETTIAIEDCELAGIHAHDFYPLLYERPDLAGQFIHLVVSGLCELNNKLIGLAYNSARKRVAEGILYIAHKYHRQLTEDMIFPVCRDDLSAISGVSPESVSRNLTDFRSERLIELHNGVLRILSLGKLANMKN